MKVLIVPHFNLGNFKVQEVDTNNTEELSKAIVEAINQSPIAEISVRKIDKP